MVQTDITSFVKASATHRGFSVPLSFSALVSWGQDFKSTYHMVVRYRQCLESRR